MRTVPWKVLWGSNNAFSMILLWKPSIGPFIFKSVHTCSFKNCSLKTSLRNPKRFFWHHCKNSLLALLFLIVQYPFAEKVTIGTFFQWAWVGIPLTALTEASAEWRKKKRLAHRSVSSYNSICEAPTWTLWSFRQSSRFQSTFSLCQKPQISFISELPEFPTPSPSPPWAHVRQGPRSYQKGFCSPWLGPGLWGWEMQLIPREVALIALRYYCGQYQKGWQTYWFQSRRWTGAFPPPRPRVWSPLGWAGTAPSHLRRGMQSPPQTISSRAELKPSIGPDDSWVYSWLRRNRSLRIVCLMCLYKISYSSVCDDVKVLSVILW